MLDVTVRIDLELSGLSRYRTAIQQGQHPAIDRITNQWAARYRGFAQRRFDRFSRGGGDWPPLKESTIKARTKARATKRQAKTTGKQDRRFGKRRVAILRDKGLLFAALNPVFSGAPGAYQQRIPFGVEVGYGGPARHPDGNATIADIARFHDEGAGHLPQRRIIVNPDAATIAGMERDAENGLDRLGRDLVD